MTELKELEVERAQLFLKEFKELLEKHDATLCFDCDWNDSDTVSAEVHFEGTGFYGAVEVSLNELTKDTDYIVSDFKVGEK